MGREAVENWLMEVWRSETRDPCHPFGGARCVLYNSRSSIQGFCQLAKMGTGVLIFVQVLYLCNWTASSLIRESDANIQEGLYYRRL